MEDGSIRDTRAVFLPVREVWGHYPPVAEISTAYTRAVRALLMGDVGTDKSDSD